MEITPYLKPQIESFNLSQSQIQKLREFKNKCETKAIWFIWLLRLLFIICEIFFFKLLPISIDPSLAFLVTILSLLFVFEGLPKLFKKFTKRDIKSYIFYKTSTQDIKLINEDFDKYLVELNKFNTDKINFKYPFNDKINQLQDRAFRKYIIKDYKSCIAINDEILSIQPLNFKALVERAACLEILNFNLDAIDDYQLAVKIDDQAGNVFGLLGLTYKKIGEMDKAKEHLNRAVYTGAPFYKSYLVFFSIVYSDLNKRMMIKGKLPENNRRRNKSDFKEDYDEISENKYQKLLKIYYKSGGLGHEFLEW